MKKILILSVFVLAGCTDSKDLAEAISKKQTNCYSVTQTQNGAIRTDGCSGKTWLLVQVDVPKGPYETLPYGTRKYTYEWRALSDSGQTAIFNTK